ncbi:phosphomannomutase/phosphoglucomutase [Methylophaga nitratireducenticrescens]|uniref:phosphomannomutase n=1 Tax=Methylophaga nitratireducenticrescens TaxID=754476 RepID=I1XHR7_METNJ|nr:phosphomannomutase/phosphoglucomutase [Methylophaga nitratireducenticrescens]AFI83936.1 phosphomannomutase/phosphoglucomutase [Methylophaga nitratireducenticrescens]
MVTVNTLTCFKAYDIRGKLGDELNPDVAYRIGNAYAKHLNAKRVAVGGDIRHTSEPLKLALAQGLMDAGAEVIDIGMVGTEEIYFASFYLDVDGGIEVTASHNPMDYNGMKLVGRDALPISGDSGLNDIRDLAERIESPFNTTKAVNADMVNTSDAAPIKNNVFSGTTHANKYQQQSILEPYVKHLMTYIDLGKVKPLKLVVNAGNGAAGHVIDAIEEQFKSANVPVEFIKVHHEADGSFPNGIPNPLLPENRAATADAVIANKADMGIAWDGDFDRCFLFDENGRFIEGYYIVGLLAEAFLLKSPGEKIIHDPRLTWNTIDQVEAAGGKPIQSKTGHAFIKERMRLENAVYGGEMSAHHYFRDFAYCDSGMLPWLLVAELISVAGKPLSELVNERMAKYPCSGEINYRVADVSVILDKILKHFAVENPVIDRTDGISLEFEQWRFNLRSSNTEPLLRLNVESRADESLMKAKVAEIEQLIHS